MARTRATELLEIGHGDLCGLSEEASVGGSRYFFGFGGRS